MFQGAGAYSHWLPLGPASGAPQRITIPRYLSCAIVHAPTAAPVPGEVPFVGRRKEIAALREHLLHARDGQGGVVVVSGPAGIGKTSLLRWLETEAERQSFSVRWGYCLPLSAGPFFPFLQLFPQATTLREKSTPDRRRRSGRSTRVARPSRSPPGGIPGLLQFLDAMETQSAAHPLVLLLDDFHWADPESIQALRLLGRNARRRSVLFAVAVRETEVNSPSLQDLLRDLRREGVARDLPLTGFREQEAQDLLESVIRAPMDTHRVRGALRALLARTGGNPYFLLETARQLQEMGQLRREEGRAVLEVREPRGTERPLDVPSNVGALLDGTFALLAPEEREVLEGASLMGPEFEPAALPAVLRKRSREVLSTLHRLTSARKLVEPVDGTPGRYRFSHILLQERIRSSIPADRKGVWILGLLHWWESERPAAVGQIFALCRDADIYPTGSAACVKAIDSALESHGHERAAGLANEMLEWMVERHESNAVTGAWGLRTLDRMRQDGAAGRWTEPLCRRLLDLGLPVPLRWQVSIRLAGIIADRVPEARRTLDQVQSEMKRSPLSSEPALQGTFALMDSVVLYNEGKTAASEAAAQRALDILPPEEKFYRGLALHRLGWVDAEQNRWADARDRIEEGLSLARSERYWGLIPYFLLMRGQVATIQGELLRAEQIFEETAGVCRDLGRMNWLATTLADLSLVRADRGDLAGAESASKEALRVSETFSIPGEIGPSLLQWSRVKLRQGFPAESMEILRRAQKAYAEHGRSTEVLEMRMHRADIRFHLGDPKGAIEELRDIEEGKLKEEQVAHLHLLRAQFLMARGDGPRARSAAERARSEATSRGLRYSAAQANATLAEWERRYGTPERAAAMQRRADLQFRECGVLRTFRFDGKIPGVVPVAASPTPPALAHRSPLAYRLLRYLSVHSAIEGMIGPRDLAPFALTQQGIAQGLGIPRDRFSMVLKRLVDRGLVSAHQHYVQGGVRRMKVYLLTDSGAQLVAV